MMVSLILSCLCGCVALAPHVQRAMPFAPCGLARASCLLRCCWANSYVFPPDLRRLLPDFRPRFSAVFTCHTAMNRNVSSSSVLFVWTLASRQRTGEPYLIGDAAERRRASWSGLKWKIDRIEKKIPSVLFTPF
jgi:hypothetical protein